MTKRRPFPAVILVLVALCALPFGESRGVDLPLTQKKIVFVLAAPDLPENAVGALPKTMYLAGDYYARIEQPADLTSGKHNLLIVQNRDIWVVDILNKTGTRSLNSSADFTVHNPILGPAGPTELFEFEYGREIAFFEKNATRELGRKTVEGIDCQAYEAISGDYRILLYTNGAKSPVRVEVFKNENLILEVKYLSYEDELPFDHDLFEPPRDIKFVESNS